MLFFSSNIWAINFSVKFSLLWYKIKAF
jgi:hypothetical protein